MYVWLESQSEARGGQEAASVHPVVVAARDLTRGMKLGPDDVQIVSFPDQSRPEGALESVESSIGRMVLEPIRSGEPVLNVKLSPAEITASPIALRTAPHKRAYPVRLQGPIGNVIASRDRIDLLVTARPANPDSNQPLAEPTSRIVVENVLVLDVLQPTAPQGTEQTEGSPSPPDDQTNIILEVTPEEAERVALAEHEGTLRAVLRHPTDTEHAGTAGVSQSQLLGLARQVGGPAAPPETRLPHESAIKRTVSLPPVQPAASSKNPLRIEVLRGGQRSEVVF
ncbi:MAG: Flp pilus assembly protein CpaB [Nitrospira sp.]|nr:Flp pilus assembly protein CpaB [Nitrospira sp.]MCP9443621.1 Flp pilus assembly protein CpaB [Nitrospira sp.]